MGEPLRVSVRRMAEFTLAGGDIAPFAMKAMLAGGRGHRARQASQGEAVSERPLKWSGVCAGRDVEVSGRADMLWLSRTPPVIEELKLWQAPQLPSAAVPVHRVQAVCYGFMLCAELGLEEIAICVSYVTEQGAVRADFPETLTASQAGAVFMDMLTPWVIWTGEWADIRQARDDSLAALPFPYAAYRPGQREMAVQVYTAISQKKRLFASLPTGTGKSAAALYPALKALGAGRTRQIFYLTARGTARQAAIDALRRMREGGLRAKCVVITAKEKCCPLERTRCHPAHCPRAKGHYDRERAGVRAIMDADEWLPDAISAVCAAHSLCPFEFTLNLCEYADVVICDYNYALDPMVVLKRIFERGRGMTLLIDEAHNLPDRARDMLSDEMDSARLALLRREAGKARGRSSALYKAFTAVMQPLRTLEADGSMPGAEALADIFAYAAALSEALWEGDEGALPPECGAFVPDLLRFLMVAARYQARPEDYAVLMEGSGRERRLRLLCLNITDHLAACTAKMPGCVYFSATLSPLEDMLKLLGGGQDDACFALPSPFPEDNLLVLHRAVDTRYRAREATAGEIALCILRLISARAGKYIAFFPSYAYMDMVRERISLLSPQTPLNAQSRGMDADGREAFLDRLRKEDGPLLSLCVLGGVFAEGIDLPGLALIGAVIVGLGLPQICPERECLRRHYDIAAVDGFAWAYRYPGMHKVLQAAGRVIRGETDAGTVLLIDARYGEAAYRRLLPPHYKVRAVACADEILSAAQEFWSAHGIHQ